MNLKSVSIFFIAAICWTTTQAQIKPPKQIVGEAKSEIVQISTDELKSKMDSGTKFIIVDVRTEKEYQCGHVQNSVWIPRGKIEFVLQEITRDPEQEIVVYCRSGGRSALSAFALNNVGFKKIYNLDGGFRKWVNSGNSVYNIHGEIKVVNFEKDETNM